MYIVYAYAHSNTVTCQIHYCEHRIIYKKHYVLCYMYVTFCYDNVQCVTMKPIDVDGRHFSGIQRSTIEYMHEYICKPVELVHIYPQTFT